VHYCGLAHTSVHHFSHKTHAGYWGASFLGIYLLKGTATDVQLIESTDSLKYLILSETHGSQVPRL